MSEEQEQKRPAGKRKAAKASEKPKADGVLDDLVHQDHMAWLAAQNRKPKAG